MSDFKLEAHSFRLLKAEPFFSALSRAVSKVCNRGIPTAGVCVNQNTGYFELHYNPDFFDNLGKTDENGTVITDEQKILDRREVESLGVLKHEFYHLVFEHVTDRLPFDMRDIKTNKETRRMAKLWNIATDLAINSEIFKELPFTACVPGRTYKDPTTGESYPGFENYPFGLSAEQYFEMLKQDPRAQPQKDDGEGEGEEGDGEGQGSGQPGNGKPGKGKGKGKGGMQGPLDDHSMWGGEGAEKEVDAVMREIAKERLKDTLRDAANEAVSGGRGWGTMSSAMQKEIIRRLNSVVDWRAVLRYFVKTSQKANRMSTMRKINRRYPYIQAGKKTARTAKVAISIDQSGSVSDQMLEVFFAELNKLSEIASFTVIPFDDGVFEEKVYEWKKGEKRKRERVLCGGTNFDSPTIYVNERNFDGHIVLTDLCAPKPINSKVRRIWMTSEECAKNPYFKTQETIIAIPNKDCGEK